MSTCIPYAHSPPHSLLMILVPYPKINWCWDSETVSQPPLSLLRYSGYRTSRSSSEVSTHHSLQFCLPLMLEKVSSDLLSAKLDSLLTIAAGCERFGVKPLHTYLQALWIAIRKEVCSSPILGTCLLHELHFLFHRSSSL